MDTTTFQRLEFPAVLEHLAGFAESPAARAALLATIPWRDLPAILRHWDAVSEVLGLLDSGGELPLRGFNDCTELLVRLKRPGALLEPGEWMDIRAQLHIAGAVRDALFNASERFPVCWPLVENIDPLPALAADIRRIFDDDGSVRDGASDELRACRQSMRRLEKDIDRVFERLLARMSKDNVLQEGFTTTRGGRRVVPVRAGARGRMPGIVHDTSNSGETLFIEPMEVIEPTNRLAEAKNQEREIIVRILGELAQRTRHLLPQLEINSEVLVQMDLWHARARLAFRHALHRPTIDPSRPLHLIQAHHPLLYFRDPGRSVPLNLRLAPEDRVLVVTGPNTGGKTTSLKTVGLLALMVQSAIPVPLGVDSRLPVFGQVLAEVGDEQSVAAGLSTFSAHIRRISAILRQCGRDALVLLDELGKATDPVQAGALGRAVLEALIGHGALTLVTTHLPTLKDWAHESPAGRNASFRLDPQSHRPQYEMHMDQPGISEAFTIARAEGLPEEIVNAAIECLPREERDLSGMLSTLHDQEETLREEVRKARAAQAAAEQARAEWSRRKAEQDHRKAEMDLTLESRYKEMLDRARADLEKRIANLPSRHALAQARKDLARDQQAAEQRIQAIQVREERILQSAAPPPALPAPDALPAGPFLPAVGDWVTVGKAGTSGRIVQIDPARKRAKVAIGGLTVDAALNRLQRALAQPEPGPYTYQGPRITTGPIEAVRPEIDIHGQRVEAALAEVERYLDRAVLCHLETVRIVHGHGTGALRAAVADLLRHHPLVKSFRLAESREGGPAVTLVAFR